MPYGTGINIKLLYTGINTDTGMKVGVGDKTYICTGVDTGRATGIA